MTLQELFDKVVNHLLTQNERAGEFGHCFYRAADGKKCAIGCLIPAHRYEPRIESVPVSELLDHAPQIFPPRVREVLQHNRCFAEELVGLHDHTAVRLWPDALLALAQEYELTPSKALLDAAAAAEPPKPEGKVC